MNKVVKKQVNESQHGVLFAGLCKIYLYVAHKSNRQSQQMSDAGPSLPDLELVLREIRAYEGL